MPRNDDMSLILAKAKMRGFFPDVANEELDAVQGYAKSLFSDDVVFGNVAGVKSVSASYGDGVQDSTAHIQSIIDSANTFNFGVYIPAGTYKTLATLENVQKILLAEGATITAGASMAAVLRTRVGTRYDGGSIGGKGTVDANTNATFAVHVRDFLYFEIKGIALNGGNTAALKLGDNGSSGRSAEAVVSTVRIINNGSVVALSSGILVENSGDHSLSQIIILNYETGIYLPVGGNAVIHDVHAWADPAKGAMKVGFEDHSNGSHYNSCHADSPTQYGWRIYGYNTTWTQSGTYLNPGVTQIADNTVVGIKFESSAPAGTIIGHFFLGGSGALRMANDILAADANYTSVVYIGCASSNVVTLRSNKNKINDLIVDSNIGTQIGLNSAQKVAFYGTAPIIRPTGTPANATDLATAQTLVNDLKTKLIALGLIS